MWAKYRIHPTLTVLLDARASIFFTRKSSVPKKRRRFDPSFVVFGLFCKRLDRDAVREQKLRKLIARRIGQNEIGIAPVRQIEAHRVLVFLGKVRARDIRVRKAHPLLRRRKRAAERNGHSDAVRDEHELVLIEARDACRFKRVLCAVFRDRSRAD